LEPSPDILPGSCSFRQQIRVKTKTGALVSEVVRLFKLRDDDEDIVRAFLRRCYHLESEYEENKHFIHLDPDRGEHTAHIDEIYKGVSIVLS